jgi:hypothetical protein
MRASTAVGASPDGSALDYRRSGYLHDQSGVKRRTSAFTIRTQPTFAVDPSR